MIKLNQMYKIKPMFKILNSAKEFFGRDTTVDNEKLRNVPAIGFTS